MNFLNQALSFIFTAANWGGPAGLAARIGEHLQYTVIAVIFSALIAIPIGMIIGHTGRGTFLVVTGVNALRALPTLGVLLLGVLLWGLGLVPPTVALMLLGIPPLLAGTYSGIANVDPAVVDAARSMGMTERRVLLRVEVPNAMPLILGVCARRRCRSSRPPPSPHTPASVASAGTSSTASRCGSSTWRWWAR